MSWANTIFNIVTSGIFEADDVNQCENEYLDGRDQGYADGYEAGRDTERAIQADIDRANEEIQQRLDQDE